MRIKNFIFLLVIFFQFSLSGQTYLELAIDMNAEPNYKRAKYYAQKAWKQKPTVYTAYLLSFANYYTSQFDSAALFAHNALYNKLIEKDVVFTGKQITQLNSIINYYKEQVVTALKNKGPTYTKTFAIRLVLSESDGRILDMEKAAALRERRERQPSWGDYIDSLRSSGIEEDIIDRLEAERTMVAIKRQIEENQQLTPETLREKVNELFFGDGSMSYESISISWIDSTKSITDNPFSQYYEEIESDYNQGYADYGLDDSDNNPFRQYYAYDGYFYPELFDTNQKNLLVVPMIRLYKRHLNGTLDKDDPLAKQYHLNAKNLELFIEQLFPQIYARRQSLDQLLSEYGF